MGRGSYAQRLAGQVPRGMPVLKPLASPFLKWNAAPVAKPMAEADTAPAPAQVALSKAPETPGATPAFSPTASSEVPETSALPPPSYFPESRQQVTPLTSIPHSPAKAGTSQRGQHRISKNTVPERLMAEQSLDVPTPTNKTPRVNSAAPDLVTVGQRPERGKQQVEENVGEGDRVTPTSATPVRSRRTPLLLNSRRSRDTVESSAAAPHSEVIAERRPATASNPAKPALKLKHSNAPAENGFATAPFIFEPRLPQHPALPAAHEAARPSATRAEAGVHIGMIDVRIVPAPPPPNINPPRSRPAAATALSRSFTSSLGLNQG